MENRQDMLSQLIQQKEILKDFSKILGVGYKVEKLLEYFLDVLQDLLKVGRIAILLEDESCFKVKAYRGISKEAAQDTSFPLSGGIVSYLTKEGTAIRMDFVKSADPMIVNELQSLGVTTAVPVWEHGRLKAVLVFNNKIIGVPITDEELELVFALGSQLAVAVQNADMVGVILGQRNYLENILINVSSAVISVDINEIITTYNPKAEEILGITASEVIGKPLKILPLDIALLIKETINTGSAIFRKEIKLTSLNKFVGISITPVKNGQGIITGAVMIFTDLAPIKALEEQMRRSDRLDFVNTVAMRSSHELKNCLVAIKTFAQLLPERYADKQFREDFYLVVNKEVDRLNQVVENLLFFAQPLKLACTSYNIEDLVQETIDSIAKDDLLAGVNIIKEFKHNSPFINIDRDAVKQALRHLLHNSIQAMPKGGDIRITTNEGINNNQTFFEMKITDTGIGIPEELTDKIWEPFFTTKTRGIGLGLTIVRKIIEAHNGSISVSGKPGTSGAEVKINLPQILQKKTGERLYFPSGRSVVV